MLAIHDLLRRKVSPGSVVSPPTAILSTSRIFRNNCSITAWEPTAGTTGARSRCSKCASSTFSAVLAMCKGNRLRAVQVRGIGRTSLYRYLKDDGYDQALIPRAKTAGQYQGQQEPEQRHCEPSGGSSTIWPAGSLAQFY